MTSRLITPPDKLRSANNFLVCNAIDEDVDKLVMYLKTCPRTYDIHLYHSGMESALDWVRDLAREVTTVIINEKFYAVLDSKLQDILELRRQSIVFYGESTDHLNLVDYFISIENS
jgi:hypothetical protein